MAGSPGSWGRAHHRPVMLWPCRKWTSPTKCLGIWLVVSSAHLSSPIHLLSPPIQPYIDTVANPQRSSTHSCPIPCCSLHTAPSTFLMQWLVPWAGCGLCRCKQASHFPFQGHNEGTHSGNPTAR